MDLTLYDWDTIIPGKVLQIAIEQISYQHLHFFTKNLSAIK